jgi:translocator protein
LRLLRVLLFPGKREYNLKINSRRPSHAPVARNAPMPDNQSTFRLRQSLALVISIAICFSVAALGGLATAPNVPTWYAELNKPTWTPPGWLFGPVWSALYLCMAIAAWLVWRRGGSSVPLFLFGAQLALNAAWSWIFFSFHNPGMALTELMLLWIAITATTVAFWRRSAWAGVLFVPYLAWVSFAGVLNFAIWRLN